MHDIKLVEHISVSAILCIYIYMHTYPIQTLLKSHEALLFMVTCLIFRHTHLQYPKTCELHPSIYLFLLLSPMIEGSLEVKLPTIWTDEKQSRAEAERRGRLEERRSEEKE